MNIQKFKFGDVEIEFDLRQGENMMVNATEMAKVFEKDLWSFTKSDHARAFIQSCLKPPYGGLLGVKSEEDLISSSQKSGTWMHQVLALKFAAWLNSDFEVWVYITIKSLLYEFAREIQDSISETVSLQRQKDDIKNQLAKREPDFLEYLSIEQKLINARSRRSNATKNKFRETMEDLFSQKGKEEKQ